MNESIVHARFSRRHFVLDLMIGIKEGVRYRASKISVTTNYRYNKKNLILHKARKIKRNH
jgi:hypothetical protein